MSIDLHRCYKHIYFIGIGGISMSGLAEILKFRGFNVSGSDINESSTTLHLQKIGIFVNIGHDAKNITDDIDLLIYTAAVKPDNPEMIAASEKGIHIIDRAELLGSVMQNYSKSVAISGTHGKTTTTSMVSEILLSASCDPTISIGGILPTINGNIRTGSSEFFVAEACEYFDSFLKFNPFVAVILNVEADHLDYFKDLQHIQTSFKHFAEHVSEAGAVVINADIEGYKFITAELKGHVISYSVKSDADYTAKNICYYDNGTSSYDLCERGNIIGNIKLNVPGEHNIANSLASYATSSFLGLEFGQICQGLAHFSGTNRRFQYKGELNGVTIVDDYAHHPTEIRATLSAAKNYKRGDLWCVFQPHTYTRTIALMSDFAESFVDADKIVLADIYAAREEDKKVVCSADLAKEISLRGKEAHYVGDFCCIKEFLKENCRPGDLLITMGAGDVYQIGDQLLNEQ